MRDRHLPTQRNKGMNESRNKLNQPPTGEGKKQSPRSGAANKLNKRSEVMQASDVRQNLGSAEDEDAAASGQTRNPERQKAGR
jgi:hypothetical protein